MAVVVTGKNYSLITSCDTNTSGGAWSGSLVVDNKNFKYSAASLSEIMKATGLNTITFTPTASIDMSGTKHLRFWFICSSLGLLDSEANGGIRVGISDGSNTGGWYLGGKDTYPGGWINLCVDVSSTVDYGTKPTAMNAITSIDIVINQTAGGKNVDNVWVDHICLCDGLVVSGDDAGGYFDFDNIFLADDAIALAVGIIRKIGGVYYLVGSLEFGLAASTTKFQAKSQIVVFEDRPVNADLYAFDIIDDGSNTTEFILGDKVGTAGIQGCTIRIEDSSQTALFDIDGKTDTDIDNFKLYGSVFYGADAISFAATATEVEVLSCNFEHCKQIDPNSAKVRKCFFIDTASSDAAILWNASIDIQDCSFIGNTTGKGIEHPAAGTFGYTDMIFSGNTYDVNNSSSASVDDSYPDTNGDGGMQLDSSPLKIGQTFVSGGGVLTRSIFSLKKTGSPSGNVIAELYATSGGVPTGTALATSNNVVADSVGGSYGQVDFEFEDEYTMVASTTYAIVISYIGTATDYLVAEWDTTSPTHSGTCYIYVSSWLSQSPDLCFYVHSGGFIKINSTDSTVSTATETATIKGATKIVSSVDVTITIIDENNDPIENAQTSVWYQSVAGGKYDTQVMNEDTNALGVATESYPGSVPVQVEVKARKSDDLDDPRYFPYSGIDTISTDGLTKTIALKVNPFI